MKRKTFCLLLILEGILLCLYRFTALQPALASGSVLTFPFAQIGLLLGLLAKTGAVGSGLASALLAALALLPAIPALRRIRQKECLWENLSLLLLAGMLLPVLYLMSSQTTLGRLFPYGDENLLSSLRLVLCASIWSVACCWLAARLLRVFRDGNRAKLLSLMQGLLMAMAAGFVAAIALFCFGDMLTAIRESQLPADAFMAALRFVASAIPYAADITIVFSAISLLQSLSAQGITESAVNAARKLSRLAGICLAVVALTCPIISLIQIILLPMLSHIHTHIVLPVTSLVFVLAAMLLSGLIADNKRLSDDNQLFI